MSDAIDAAMTGPDFAFPMDDAPKDGSILRLLVRFDPKSSAGAFYDTAEPSWTIGTNNKSNTGEDQWDICGWSWERDVFCHAHGAKPIGWLPFHTESKAPAGLPPALTAYEAAKGDDLPRDDTGRITSDYQPTPLEIEVAKQAICREFGNNGTDGYYIRILKAIYAARPPVEAAKGGGVDYFGSLVEKARAAAAKASIKFPQPNYVTLKIAEEAGEVVRGAVHYAENRMEWSEVEGEIVQLLAMLIRFVTEGDQINGVTPPSHALTSPASGEQDAVIEECAKVADGLAATHRSIGKMNLPAGGGPVIQEDRARIAEACATAIRSMLTKVKPS